MGVMLSLDRHRPGGGRRRAQHARREDGWARARALATARRCDAPVGAGLLSRLIRVLLPWRERSAGSRLSSYERDHYRGTAAPRGAAAPPGGRDAGRAPAA
jgi:hypothetical protein